MRWEKKGLIFQPDKNLWWQQFYGMLPTPVYLEKEGVIRVFFSTSCEERFSRITFLDLDPSDPSRVVYQAPAFVLDLGEPGTFDDSGLIPTCILQEEEGFRLYYSGYQRHVKVPYSILSGMAVSKDGKNFSRATLAPQLERTDEEMNIRSAPFVLKFGGQYHLWYTAGSGWKTFESGLFAGRNMPTYFLRYATSPDGITWNYKKEPVFPLELNEFGISRPWVIRKGNEFEMYYSIRSVDEPYKLGYATSKDGISWVRRDAEMGITVSGSGWDSEMLCYPAVITIFNKTYLFYNGNKNGETGFGYAELAR